MREILFRGKRLDNGEWVQGVFVPDYTQTAFYITKVGEFCHKVDPETVGQFTGLTDKNGTKVFEGDILQTEDRIVVVEWHRRSASWDSKFVKFLEPRESRWAGILCSQWGEYAAVIGNIYDNPDLIGGADNG